MHALILQTVVRIGHIARDETMPPVHIEMTQKPLQLIHAEAKA